MHGNEILALGLGLDAPWTISSQTLDTAKNPHELRLKLSSGRGQEYPCPVCGKSCKAHDFKDMTWRHLNFFQHHCYIRASVPRVNCPEHGVKRIIVPWARKGSKFTLLFEQAALILAREMPIKPAAKIIGITDKRLWRIVFHYVKTALSKIDLSGVQAVGLDETASKRGHNYVTVFIDMKRSQSPVLFAIAGKGKATVKAFKVFLEGKRGCAENIVEVVCDMSPAFLNGIKENFPKANVTVDWFHIVQKFVKAVDETRKREHRESPLPKGSRFAVLTGPNKPLTQQQIAALNALLEAENETATAWQIKESLAWIRNAESTEQAEQRITLFLDRASKRLDGCRFTSSVTDALKTLKKHATQAIQRWTSTYTNARMEGWNSLFQAARARARGYRNTETFIAIIYMIASPVGAMIKST